MNTEVFNQELLSFHARKILRFYRDVIYCHIASPARYSDTDDIKIDAAKKCHKVIVNHEENLNLILSYDYILNFLIKSRMIKAIESLGIHCDFDVLFYNYFLTKRNYDYILGKKPESEDVNKIESSKLICFLVLCACDYLNDIDVSESISNEIAYLIGYKEKLEHLLSLHDDLAMSEFNNMNYHEIIVDNNSFNPLVIERRIEILKNELLTKRNDGTKKERGFLSEVVKLFLKGGYEKGLGKAMNIISSSPLLNDYIDPRTVSRIVAKAKENKSKSDDLYGVYTMRINARGSEVTKIKREQSSAMISHKHGLINPLSCRKNFLILKFKAEIDDLQ